MTDFLFLRPFWLLLLLVVPVIVLVQRRRSPGTSAWQRIIPPALLRPLLPERSGKGQHHRRNRLIPPLLLALGALALAGPSFRTAPAPLNQQDDALVVVLDQSLSMLATDVEPDRSTRAIRKIRDLLATREGAFTGLVVYAGDGHVVTPLTDDRRTIEGLLTALDPLIMPATGNRADMGVARAIDLLERGTGGRGRILLITDGIGERYRRAIAEQLAESPWQLDGLLVGTPGGSPIPIPRSGFIRDGDEVVISRASMNELAVLARQAGGEALAMTTSDEDIARLGLRATDQGDWREGRDERTTERRQDDGYWLLWLAVPLALLGWRRGVLITVTSGLLWLPPTTTQALQWEDLWQTPEQRAPDLIRDDPARAARKLDDPQWRGLALFRNGQYENAAEAFGQGSTADAHYNRGNALAHAGKPQAALEAWQQALAKDPNHAPARHNHELVSRFLDQQQDADSSGDPSQSGQQDQGQQSGASGGDQQGADQNQDSGSPASGENGPPARDETGGSSGEPDPAQPGQAASPLPEESESARGSGRETTPRSQSDRDQTNGPAPAPTGPDALSQSQEQWLRRIPDDPGGLLKRKFLQQSRSRNLPPDEGDTPW
ncbi:Ca-activated chloride channel family protein [Marinobacter daqiaonensis]|uniref:Ca-activated chloride channel family protein n=1 Tax=Marinobacter daqiaonensis TaxID=650891 RepID=A0A1I6H5J1_9GAMM|nr:VWA domain-containing protein [Marinobacter daqiaonensis]SFR49682.1 Ca-activated chloride channel family protein [Marinobacter daqiaonensis]